MYGIKDRLSFSTAELIMLLVSCGLLFRKGKGNPTCEFPYTKTDGEFIDSMEDKYFTAHPFEIISNSTPIKCSMLLTANAKAKAMNVIQESQNAVACQLFDHKADNKFEDEFLEDNTISTYYEKVENFIEATSSLIVVGAKDNTPGTFTFQLPTGNYKIKLNHVSGGIICHQGQSVEMSFGCKYPAKVIPNFIAMYTGYNGDRVVYANGFDEHEEYGGKMISVATSKCFELTEGSTYSFWYYEDWEDLNEHDNYGETSFEIFVQLCEKSNDCI